MKRSKSLCIINLENYPSQNSPTDSGEEAKKYQAFDDFENAPIHATYLIDAAGKVRWHDVGPEPFMNVDFLLEESRRLLDPYRVELPKEPVLLDESAPADALSPRNVFTESSSPTVKRPA